MFGERQFQAKWAAKEKTHGPLREQETFRG